MGTHDTAAICEASLPGLTGSSSALRQVTVVLTDVNMKGTCKHRLNQLSRLWTLLQSPQLANVKAESRFSLATSWEPKLGEWP